jgi:hypothetical protein
MSSNDSTDHGSAAEQKGFDDSGRGFDDSASSSEGTAFLQGTLDSPNSPVVAFRTPRVNRVPSALSSACSFGSVSGDELDIILSEEDEYNETDDQENSTPSPAKKSPSPAKHPHITNEGSAERLAGRKEAWLHSPPLEEKETGETTKSLESDDDVASKESGDGVVSKEATVENPTSKGGRKMKGKKRRKKSKDKDASKCIIQ